MTGSPRGGDADDPVAAGEAFATQAPHRPGTTTTGQGPLATLVLPAGGGRTWHVDAAAGAGGTGDQARPFATVQEGLNAAQAGDTVLVAPGTYTGPVRTVRPGTATRPIALRGVPGATLTGVAVDRDRLLTVTHDWTVVANLTVTRADKGIWVQGASHVTLTHNRVHGTGGECIRMKYGSRANEVVGNLVGPCGLVNYDLSLGRKNGEGLYIGTAPEQLYKNPTPEPDTSNGNRVHENVFRTQAECVDVKESAEYNVVEHNDCAGGTDPDGSALDARGNRNVFRYNAVRDYVGKGVRLGGDTPDQGIHNDVRGNLLLRTGSYAIGAMRLPQGVICGNVVGSNLGVINAPIAATAPCP